MRRTFARRYLSQRPLLPTAPTTISLPHPRAHPPPPTPVGPGTGVRRGPVPDLGAADRGM